MESTKRSSAGDSLEGMLNAILSRSEAEALAAASAFEALPCVREAAAAMQKGDYRSFAYQVLYPIQQVVDGLLAKLAPKKPRAQFILKHSSFVEAHFGYLIEAHEGASCSKDKERAIVRRLLGYYLEERPIEFDPNAKFTFHYPKVVFTSQAEILEFFEGVYALYYGHPEKYLAAMASIYQRRSARSIDTGEPRVAADLGGGLER